LFTFAHGVDGLPSIFHFDTFSYGGHTAPLPTLCSPWGQEAILVAVDENGIISVDIRNLVQYHKELAQNIKLISLEKLADSIEAYLTHTYSSAADSISDSEITVTHIELCASLIGVKDKPSAGRLIPSWFVRYEFRGSNMNSYTDELGLTHEATTFTDRDSKFFSAIDGSYIEPRITNDMIE